MSLRERFWGEGFVRHSTAPEHCFSYGNKLRNQRNSQKNNRCYISPMKSCSTEHNSNEFGGSLLVGKRHSTRPLDFRVSKHLVLKADEDGLLLKNQASVQFIVSRFAKKFEITLYSLAVQSDHIHFSLSIPNREQYKRWIRAVSSQLVANIPGLKWTLRPYTRVVSWGWNFENVQNYIFRNQLQANFLFAAEMRIVEWLTENTRAWPLPLAKFSGQSS
jgi:hypothetical protein